MSTTTTSWVDANQRRLVDALAEVRQALEAHIAAAGGAGKNVPAPRMEPPPGELEPESGTTPAALDTLCARFGLSMFERALLLLCAGVELDTAFARLCAEAQGGGADPSPTFSLALAALREPHWSAITAAAPLRHWRLIDVGHGAALTTAPLRIDERVLHYLAGVQHLDERLAGMLDPVAPPEALADSHGALVERLARRWTHGPNDELPLLQLSGRDRAGKRAVAGALCQLLGLQLWALPAALAPTDPAEFDAFVRLWEREAALASSALLVDCDDLDPADRTRAAAVDRVLARLGGPVLVSVLERQGSGMRSVVSVEVAKPTRAEQRAVWHQVVGTAAPNGAIDRLVGQFDLSLAIIRDAGAEAMVGMAHGDARGALTEALWDACRAQARPRLDDLAQRIEPVAVWEDMALPATQQQTLHDVTVHVRHRLRVYEDWGFAAKGHRGLGISTLFAGPSGTGKTLAAEILAGELRLDLYRIDLSQVVSKYIGETEKNLRRVFDAAEDGGAVLLFDEADALFGKRSEVKDSHDRYANIEVGYLLQRMEAYRGLAILTTNMKDALDPAFLRRIRFVVHFPFPDARLRAEIWRRIFPAQTPTEDLDVARLARLNIAGGNIRNIALHAAFLAADAGEPVCMAHLLRAARSEYAKLDRPLTEAETAGWR